MTYFSRVFHSHQILSLTAHLIMRGFIKICCKPMKNLPIFTNNRIPGEEGGEGTVRDLGTKLGTTLAPAGVHFFVKIMVFFVHMNTKNR